MDPVRGDGVTEMYRRATAKQAPIAPAGASRWRAVTSGIVAPVGGSKGSSASIFAAELGGKPPKVKDA